MIYLKMKESYIEALERLAHESKEEWIQDIYDLIQPVKLVPIPEPVEALEPTYGTHYDSENDVPDMSPQLCQVFEAEDTLTPMNDIIRRYAFKGIRRI